MSTEIQRPLAAQAGSKKEGRRQRRAFKRIEFALACLSNPEARSFAGKVAAQMKGSSVFWDPEDHQVEFVADTWEVIIRQREPSNPH